MCSRTTYRTLTLPAFEKYERSGGVLYRYDRQGVVVVVVVI